MPASLLMAVVLKVKPDALNLASPGASLACYSSYILVRKWRMIVAAAKFMSSIAN